MRRVCVSNGAIKNLRVGQPKGNKVKIFLPLQTKFQAHTVSNSKVIRSKKVKIYH